MRSVGARTAKARRSAGRPADGATADDVHVEMEDALPGAGTAVHDEPEVGASVGARDLDRDAREVSDQRIVLGCQIGKRGDVFAGDDEYVRRTRRIDVAERDGAIVLVHAIRPCLAGRDSTEEAVGHGAAVTGLAGGRKTSRRAQRPGIAVDFALTPEQTLLQRTARDVLAANMPMSRVRALMDDPRGVADADWRRLADLGWTGLLVTEEYGGAGLGMLELAIVVAEMGRVAMPGPFLGTIVAGRALMHAGNDAQRRRWLPGLADGSVRATVALVESSARWDFDGVTAVARPDGDGWVLAGTKLFVPDAHAVDLIVCAVRRADDGEPALVVVDAADAAITPQPSVDRTRCICRVALDGVRIAADRMLAGDAAASLDAVLTEARVALAADMTGGAERVLEMTVEHVKTRRQFGRAIGTFQAVQHACADMMVAVECAKAATTYAAWAVAERADDATVAAATAKATAGDAYRQVTAKAIQLHGGIGFTWEHDLHVYYKRAMSTEATFGDATWSREIVAEGIGLQRLGSKPR